MFKINQFNFFFWQIIFENIHNVGDIIFIIIYCQFIWATNSLRKASIQSNIKFQSKSGKLLF